MEASAIPGWSDFFAAAAGVAGALAGLVFVGLSINLTQILQLPTAIGRAAETLFVLAGVLVIDLVALVPAQSERHLATLLLIAAIPVWLLPLIAQFRAIGDRPPGRGFLVPMRMLLHQAGTLPIVAGALVLFFGHANTGIGLVAAGCILSILVAMLSAWVLLVEIQR
jgi:modulator of FtsH protease